MSRVEGSAPKGSTLRKGSARIAGCERRVDRAGVAVEIDGGEDAAVHRQQVRGELDLDGAAGDASRIPGRTRPDDGACRRRNRRWVPSDSSACSRFSFSDRPAPLTPCLEVDHDPVEVDHPGLDQRADRILPGRRVAAGAGDKPGGADFVAVELGQAVDGFVLQLAAGRGAGHTMLIGRRGRAGGNRRKGRRSSGRAAGRR